MASTEDLQIVFNHDYYSAITLSDEHIPLLLRKLHHLENKWEEIGNTGKNLEFPDFRNCIGQLSAWPVLYISCTRSDDF